VSGRRAPAIVLAAGLLGLAGCHREVPADMPQGSHSPADATYRTRGVVSQLPAAPDGEMVLFHEAVREFVDRKGERSGMDSMSMPFAVAEGVPLEGIAEGDKVAFTFELRWEGDPTLLVTALEELPADAELQLGRGATDTETDPPAPSSSPSPDPAGAADGAAPRGSSEAI
jgi:Cu/Ag efflux protein CusF